MKQVFLVLFLLGPFAVYASKARLTALGQDSKMGSYYLEDSRNVFKNPALLNSSGDFAIVEAADSDDPDTGEGNILQGHGEGAEGGVFKKISSDISMGVYLGNALNDNSSQVSGTGYAGSSAFSAPTAMEANENVNLFIAGEQGVRWGVRISKASSSTKTPADSSLPEYEKEHDQLGIGVGVDMGKYKAYAHMDIQDEYKGGTVTTSNAYEKDHLIEASWQKFGASMKVKDIVVFADFDLKKVEATTGAATKVTDETEKSVVTLGAGYSKAVREDSMVFVDLSLKKSTSKDTNGDPAAIEDKEIEKDQMEMPLVVAFEKKATSWLILRASVKQNILIGNEKVSGYTDAANKDLNVEKGIDADTSVNLGMGLDLDELQIDGTLGTTEGGLVDSRNIAGRVGVSYFF